MRDDGWKTGLEYEIHSTPDYIKAIAALRKEIGEPT
jgi:hypothetical protein